MVIPDFKGSDNLWAKSMIVEKIQHQTKGYKRWNHINTRCKVGGEFQRKKYTYVGCYTDGEFRSFQGFMGWYTNQIGYERDDYQIDKDILIPNNKCYSERTCVLVPKALNCFLLGANASRGAYPQGVYFHKKAQSFAASINIDNKRKHIGLFSTPELAFRAYISAKEAEAYRWYERLRDGEFPVQQVVIDRMKSWKYTLS